MSPPSIPPPLDPPALAAALDRRAECECWCEEIRTPHKG
jgi:hypothetical protein